MTTESTDRADAAAQQYAIAYALGVAYPDTHTNAVAYNAALAGAAWGQHRERDRMAGLLEGWCAKWFDEGARLMSGGRSVETDEGKKWVPDDGRRAAVGAAMAGLATDLRTIVDALAEGEGRADG